MSNVSPKTQPIALEIWNMKYRLRDERGEPRDSSIDQTFRRVAQAVSRAEVSEEARSLWSSRFFDALADFGFIPGGRLLAGAGSNRNVTLFNCFVMETLQDDLGGIFESLKTSALTMQMGGGIGIDFSPLRPKGWRVAGVGADASGPVSFMDVWDGMCGTIKSAGARRGAMMATLRADHPDIFEFVAAKTDPGRLTNFNISVLVPDALMKAVEQDAPWDLVFAEKVYRTVAARDLWQQIMRATYDFAEPGVIFIDRVNERNNLRYCETIEATNPCGEQPLPPSGACLLGAINLTRFVSNPFRGGVAFDEEALRERTRVAVRFLDNAIDVSAYPNDRQRDEAHAKRRIGLGITGLADALAMCGLPYSSDEAVGTASRWMRLLQETAYLASAQLAAEKGAFPLFDRANFGNEEMMCQLSPHVRQAIEENGIRNGCLTTIAPTGTTSLLAGNVSSGIEPVFDFTYKRRILEADGGVREEAVEDYAYRLFRQIHGATKKLPDAFIRATDLSPREHIRMQAALQPFVDSAISKTVNCPEDISFDAFEGLYLEAYKAGLKGLTTYRPSRMRGAVLSSGPIVPVSIDEESDNPGKSDAEGGASAPEAGSRAWAASNASPLSGPGACLQNASMGTPREQVTIGADVVYLAPPMERAPVLHGATYKLKWPGSEHALYVTINDVVREGRRRPFEIFINTKSLEHYAWTVALTRMISAVFRRGGDVRFVAEELQAIFDPQGGRWVSGRYVPSLQAAIGEIIEGHMQAIGFTDKDTNGFGKLLGAEEEHGSDAPIDQKTLPGLPTDEVEFAQVAAAGRMNLATKAAVGSTDLSRATGQAHRQCPRCGTSAYVRREGCWICERCGYAQCD